MNADGTDEHPLTSDGASERPSFSPDGRQIAFIRIVGGHRRLFVMRADGGGVTRLTSDPALAVVGVATGRGEHRRGLHDRPRRLGPGRGLTRAREHLRRRLVARRRMAARPAPRVPGSGERRPRDLPRRARAHTERRRRRLADPRSAAASRTACPCSPSTPTARAGAWSSRRKHDPLRWIQVGGWQTLPCTITGTPGSDTINGTAGDDVICGLAGNDTWLGGPGNDEIDGGSGTDGLKIGPGNDRLLAFDDFADTLDGGAGSDRARTDRGLGSGVCASRACAGSEPQGGAATRHLPIHPEGSQARETICRSGAHAATLARVPDALRDPLRVPGVRVG
jgi:hypothetical protein